MKKHPIKINHPFALKNCHFWSVNRNKPLPNRINQSSQQKQRLTSVGTSFPMPTLKVSASCSTKSDADDVICTYYRCYSYKFKLYLYFSILLYIINYNIYYFILHINKERKTCNNFNIGSVALTLCFQGQTTFTIDVNPIPYMRSDFNLANLFHKSFFNRRGATSKNYAVDFNLLEMMERPPRPPRIKATDHQYLAISCAGDTICPKKLGWHTCSGQSPQPLGERKRKLIGIIRETIWVIFGEI